LEALSYIVGSMVAFQSYVGGIGMKYYNNNNFGYHYNMQDFGCSSVELEVCTLLDKNYIDLLHFY
jgi:hypothetical protein